MADLRSLVRRARDGDREAYGEIVRRFQDMAYGYAFSILGDFHLAEDAAQEAFMEAYHGLSKLRDPKAFPGWLRRIVRTQCGRLTRRKKVPTAQLEAASAVASDSPGPAEAAETSEMKDRALEAIRSLPEAERTATTLFYIDGYSVKDISAFLEAPVGTVKRRLHDSRNRLKERMLAMVEKTLKDNPLPAGFDDMLKQLVLFPASEPRIRVSKAKARNGQVTFREGAWFFVPLQPSGQGIAAWYDWPDRKLTSVGCMRVLGRSKVDGMNCFRVRMPEFDPDGCLTYDHEWHWAIRDKKVYLVGLSNFEPGAKKRTLRKWTDPDWREGRAGWPMKLDFKSRVNWDSARRGSGPRFPRTQVVAGLWNVEIGNLRFECLRTLTLSYKGQRKGHAAGQLARSYWMLADCYIDMSGRTVLFRRYNGPVWGNAKSSSSIAALARKGCPELRYNGVEFRLWYDCIPLHALAPGEETSL